MTPDQKRKQNKFFAELDKREPIDGQKLYSDLINKTDDYYAETPFYDVSLEDYFLNVLRQLHDNKGHAKMYAHSDILDVFEDIGWDVGFSYDEDNVYTIDLPTIRKIDGKWHRVSESNYKTNSAYEDIDIAEKVGQEFEMQGYQNISTGVFSRAVYRAARKVHKIKNYEFLNNVGIYGGFKVPVDEVNGDLVDIIEEVVSDIVEELESREKKNKKKKSWNDSGKLK